LLNRCTATGKYYTSTVRTLMTLADQRILCPRDPFFIPECTCGAAKLVRCMPHIREIRDRFNLLEFVYTIVYPPNPLAGAPFLERLCWHQDAMRIGPLIPAAVARRLSLPRFWVVRPVSLCVCSQSLHAPAACALDYLICLLFSWRSVSPGCFD
jgi:hypothetical protein